MPQFLSIQGFPAVSGRDALIREPDERTVFHPIAAPGLLACLLLIATSVSIAQTPDSTVAVSIIPDESDAVLSILEKKQEGGRVAEADWRRLFSTDGYVRLKKREAWIHREFTDDEFKAFVLSDSLFAKRGKLRATLDTWTKVDVAGSGKRVLQYLPAGAHIRAKIYPVIKPKSNSFVFDGATDPAIFLYVDPGESPEKFENTLAHELHHIGFTPSWVAARSRQAGDSALTPAARTVLGLIGSFGEGFAMLAAAGGPDVHPHAFSPPADRERWDRDMMNFNDDLGRVGLFFANVLDGRLTGDQIDSTAGSFYGVQGPWYTVGWKMAVTIEKAYGREKLIECMCDPVMLLQTYNGAATARNRASNDTLATWSPSVIGRLGR